MKNLMLIFLFSFLTANLYSQMSNYGSSWGMVYPNTRNITINNYGCNGKGVKIEGIEFNYKIEQYTFNTLILRYELRANIGKTYYTADGKTISVNELGGLKDGSIDVWIDLEFQNRFGSVVGKSHQMAEGALKNGKTVRDSRLIDCSSLGLKDDYDLSQITSVEPTLVRMTYNNLCYDNELNKLRKEEAFRKEMELLWKEVRNASKPEEKVIILQKIISKNPGDKEAITELEKYQKEIAKKGRENQISKLEQEANSAANKGDWDAAVLAAAKLRKLDPENSTVKIIFDRAKSAKSEMRSANEAELAMRLQQKKVATESQSKKENVTSYQSLTYRPWEFEKAMSGAIPDLTYTRSKQDVQKAYRADNAWKTLGRLDNLSNDMNKALDDWRDASFERIKREESERLRKAKELQDKIEAANRARDQKVNDCKEQHRIHNSQRDQILREQIKNNKEAYKAAYGLWDNYSEAEMKNMSNYFDQKIDLNSCYIAEWNGNYLILTFEKGPQNTRTYKLEFFNFDNKKINLEEAVSTYLATLNGVEIRNAGYSTSNYFREWKTPSCTDRTDHASKSYNCSEIEKRPNAAILDANILTMTEVEWKSKKIEIASFCVSVSYFNRYTNDYEHIYPTSYSCGDCNNTVYSGKMGYFKAPLYYIENFIEKKSYGNLYSYWAMPRFSTFELDDNGNLISINSQLPYLGKVKEFIVFKKFSYSGYNPEKNNSEIWNKNKKEGYHACWISARDKKNPVLYHKNGWVYSGPEDFVKRDVTVKGSVNYLDGRIFQGQFKNGYATDGTLFMFFKDKGWKAVAKGGLDLEGKLNGYVTLLDLDGNETNKGWFLHGRFLGDNIDEGQKERLYYDRYGLKAPLIKQDEIDKAEAGKRQLLEDQKKLLNAKLKGDLVIFESPFADIDVGNTYKTYKHSPISYQNKPNNWQKLINWDIYDIIYVDYNYNISAEMVKKWINDGKTVVLTGFDHINFDKANSIMKSVCGNYVSTYHFTKPRITDSKVLRRFSRNNTKYKVTDGVYKYKLYNFRIKGPCKPIIKTDIQQFGKKYKNQTTAFEYKNKNGGHLVVVSFTKYDPGTIFLYANIHSELKKRAVAKKVKPNFKFYAGATSTKSLSNPSYLTPEGKGILVKDSGDTLSGNFKDGKLNGEGWLYSEKFKAYFYGSFENDKISGNARVRTIKGDNFEGFFSNGIAQNGTWKYLNGTVYTGEVNEELLKNGKGNLKTKEGLHSVGEWKNDKQHGQATVSYPSGDKYIGAFEYDKKNGKGQLITVQQDKYSGFWKDDLMNGDFEIDYADGSRYVGKLYNDKRNGFATFTDSKGNILTCNFSDNEANGSGKLSFKNGNILTAEFKSGAVNGPGDLLYSKDNSKYRYIGNFTNSEIKGEGTVYFKDGSFKKGSWEKGELKEEKTSGEFSIAIIKRDDTGSIPVGLRWNNNWAEPLKKNQSTECIVEGLKLDITAGITNNLKWPVNKIFNLEKGMIYTVIISSKKILSKEDKLEIIIQDGISVK